MTGHWIHIIRAIEDDFESSGRAPSHDLGRLIGHFDVRRNWASVEALAAAAREEGVIGESVLIEARQKGLAGFFNLLTNYRRDTIKVVQPTASFCERFAALWLEALGEVFASGALWSSAQLYVRKPSGWFLLRGLGSLPVEEDLDAAGPIGSLRMQIAGSGSIISPLAIYLEDEDRQRESVALLSTFARNRRRAPPQKITAVVYLDYLSGEVSSADAASAMQELLGSVRGRPVSEPEMNELASRGAEDLEALAEPAKVGARIGDYQIVSQIGRGAMGIVFEAIQSSLRRSVAVKVLPAALADNPILLRRFSREVRALAKCDHSNVVKVYAAHTDPRELGDDPPHFAMELVEGIDLHRLSKILTEMRADLPRLGAKAISTALARGMSKETSTAPSPFAGQVDFYRALAKLFAGAAEGLAELHARGIIHRDLKPSNLVVTPDGRLVVMDLGLALIEGATELTQTRAGPVGTPRFMPPEQFSRDEVLDARADIYALGASLQEVATGKSFGASESEISQSADRWDTIHPRRADPAMPKPLADIICVATAKQREDRYPDARAFARDLEQFATLGTSSARPTGRAARMRRAIASHPLRVAAVSIILAMLAAGSREVWRWYFGTVEHCYAWTMRWGEPACLRKIDPDFRARVDYGYELELRRGRLVRMTRRNSSGTLRDATDAPSFFVLAADDTTHGISQWVPQRDEEGRVVRLDGLNRNGAIVKQWEYIRQSEKRWTCWYRDKNLQLRKEGNSEVVGARWILNDEGLIEEAYYMSGHSKPRALANGEFGARTEYDPLGREVKRISLSLSSRPQNRRQGSAIRIKTRDENGYLIGMYYFDPDLRPSVDSGRIHGTRYENDPFGNPILKEYVGLDGRRTLHSSGAAIVRTRYDERGNAVEIRHFDAEDRPTMVKDGYSVVLQKVDARGLVVEKTYFDTGGNPTLTQKGYHRFQLGYDDRGNFTEEIYFDLQGRRTLGSVGFSRGTWRYDAAGDEVEAAYFDVDDRPIRNDLGFAKRLTRFDERHNKVEETYFGVDGKPTLIEHHYARVTWSRDERGNVVEDATFGTTGAPIDNRRGFARVVRTFASERSTTAFFGADGRPAINRSTGLASVVNRYDSEGNLIENSYFGVSGEPVLDKEDGCARETFVRDQLGNITERRCFGADGAASKNKLGAHLVKIGWNDRGLNDEKSWFDEEGRPVLNVNGCARVRFDHDDRGNETAQSCFGVDGAPKRNKWGYARVTMTYDDHDRRIEEANWGENGELVADSDGYARLAMRYDARGNEVEVSYFGPDGRPVVTPWGFARYTQEFSERGSAVGVTHFGAHGELVLASRGFARRQGSLDANQVEIRADYFGVDNRPARIGDGYAIAKCSRDSHWRKVEERYFDVDEKPIANQSRVARIIWTYDERGALAGASEFDLAGNRIGASSRRANDYFCGASPNDWAEADEEEL